MEEERIKLAIKFEKERKNDIIKLLEYFGGKKDNICIGFPGDAYCYIDLDGNINAMLSWNSRIMDFDRFDYSEFIKKIQFIPGDKVTVNLLGFEKHPEKVVGKLIWNSKSKSIAYSMRCECEEREIYSPDVLDPVVKEVTVNNIEDFLADKKISSINFQDQEHYTDEVELCLSDQHEIKEKNGKWFVVKKKSELPNTYEECCSVLEIMDVINGYKLKLLSAFQELLICRDAYWKLAGDWKPDWEDNSDKYFICYVKNKLWTSNIRDCNRFLVFPTEEMRDKFYENFKDLIEKCKELL